MGGFEPTTFRLEILVRGKSVGMNDKLFTSSVDHNPPNTSRTSRGTNQGLEMRLNWSNDRVGLVLKWSLMGTVSMLSGRL